MLYSLVRPVYRLYLIPTLREVLGWCELTLIASGENKVEAVYTS